MALTEREQQVINWSTQEIDGGVKLGEIVEGMLETDGGMFSANDHADVDHEGLTGIPSISGLLVAVPAENQASSTEQATPNVAEFNALLDKLKAAGLMVDDIGD